MSKVIASVVFVSFLGINASSGLLEQVWAALTSSLLGDVPAGDEGCGWDPYGGCKPTQSSGRLTRLPAETGTKAKKGLAESGIQ